MTTIEKKEVARYLLDATYEDKKMLMQIATGLNLCDEPEDVNKNSVSEKEKLDLMVNGVVEPCDQNSCKYFNKGFCESVEARDHKCNESDKHDYYKSKD